jgi:seryl-tRNA synthetase
LDEQKADLNALSKQAGLMKAQGNEDGFRQAQESARSLKEQIGADDERVRELDEQISYRELSVPNLPHDSVPDGSSAEENVEMARFGEQPKFDFEPKPHWELATNLGIIDFAAGAKISGSGFIVYRGMGARLQRALFNYMVEFQVEQRGYTEIYPPYLVNRTSLISTGNLPKFEDDLYRCDTDDMFLIPTAEVPVTNLLRDEILEASQLPLHFAAYSGCFRREAGAAGKDTRGLLRVHQFDKVELVKFCAPSTSYHELETMRGDAEAVLSSLGLHFRTMLLCSGELSFSNAKCYDLEVWAPGIQQYLEVSSASNFEAFQARRARIRFRPEPGAKPEFVHTLNASGVACPRLFAAILETYQQADGSVVIPEPLRRYTGAATIPAN